MKLPTGCLCLSIVPLLACSDGSADIFLGAPGKSMLLLVVPVGRPAHAVAVDDAQTPITVQVPDATDNATIYALSSDCSLDQLVLPTGRIETKISEGRLIPKGKQIWELVVTNGEPGHWSAIDRLPSELRDLRLALPEANSCKRTSAVGIDVPDRVHMLVPMDGARALATVEQHGLFVLDPSGAEPFEDAATSTLTFVTGIRGPMGRLWLTDGIGIIVAGHPDTGFERVPRLPRSGVRPRLAAPEPGEEPLIYAAWTAEDPDALVLSSLDVTRPEAGWTELGRISGSNGGFVVSAAKNEVLLIDKRSPRIERYQNGERVSVEMPYADYSRSDGPLTVAGRVPELGALLGDDGGFVLHDALGPPEDWILFNDVPDITIRIIVPTVGGFIAGGQYDALTQWDRDVGMCPERSLEIGGDQLEQAIRVDDGHWFRTEQEHRAIFWPDNETQIEECGQ